MMKILMTTFLLLFNLSEHFAQTNSKTFPDSFSQPIVTLQAFDENGTLLRQTFGLFVNDEADVITNYSILEGAMRYKVITHDGKDFYVTKIVLDEQQKHIVLLSTNAPQKTYPIMQINKTTTKSQEKAFALVLGANSETSSVEVTISKIQKDLYTDKLFFDSEFPVSPQGALLVNQQGEFLGFGNWQNSDKNGFVALAGVGLPVIIQGLIESRKLNDKIARLDTAPDAHKDDEGSIKIEGEIEGKAIKRFAPKYPKLAKSNRIQALIHVQINVDEQGNVFKAVGKIKHLTKSENVSEQVAEESGEILKKAATEAAYKWRFTPTIQDGKPIKVIGWLAFNFVH
jgi:hypothetical protein